MRTSLRRRPFGLFLLTSLALLVCLLPAAEQADADGAGHPYFNDRGTLQWHESLAAAKRAARRDGKVIFVEYGRHRCSNCRKLAENVLPHPSIGPRLSQVAIGLAADCDTPEREIWQLFRQRLPGARSLPFVAFLTPDGQWITGWAGYTRIPLMSTELSRAERFHTRLLRVRAEKRRAAAAGRRHAAPEPTPTPPPQPRPETMLQKPAAEKPATSCVDPEPRVKAEGCGEDHDPCADGSCEYNPDGCRPRFRVPDLFGRCKPCPPRKPAPTRPCPTTAPPERPAAPVIGSGSPDGDVPTGFPEKPSERVQAPERVLATGSPEGTGSAAFPPPAKHPTLPAPRVKPATQPTPRSTPTPKPTVRMTPQAALAAAEAAAAKADWAEVLTLTRHAKRDHRPALFALNRRAHAWAHGLLADAVRDIRARRYAEAHAAVETVRETMRGEAESVDAERGAEAIELMQDIEPLAQQSLVRRTVRKTAYEKMRGTRWAPLFSPVPQPTAAVATK